MGEVPGVYKRARTLNKRSVRSFECGDNVYYRAVSFGGSGGIRLPSISEEDPRPPRPTPDLKNRRKMSVCINQGEGPRCRQTNRKNAHIDEIYGGGGATGSVGKEEGRRKFPSFLHQSFPPPRGFARDGEEPPTIHREEVRGGSLAETPV